MANTQKPNYWIVGASWGGINLQGDNCANNGYWMIGHKSDDTQAIIAKDIKPGDRIAIKRSGGRGNEGTIFIDHIGIVKGVVHDTEYVTRIVDWVARDLGRIVDGKGNFGTVVRAYTMPADKDWLQEIFCL